ncbi:MAG: exo-alpha-sialidase [Ignavibacteriales bacterium]|nr:exo-alpha-sialidase [Ignavibacteriales bacterium]
MKKTLFALFAFFAFTSLPAQFKNIRVSNSSASQPNEVSITINPANPSFIAAGSNLNLLYTSADEGRTWSQKQMSSIWRVYGDPCLVYDKNGFLFYGHLSDQRNTGSGYWIDRIVVQRSATNGTDWDYDVGVGYAPPVKQQDKEWIGVDLSDSKFKNNLYMAWTEFDKYGSSSTSDSTRILLSRSTNNGQSWSSPIRINTRSGDCIDDDNTVEGCVPAVGPNGEVYLSWSGPAGLMFDKSTDGGVTFGSDVKVSSLYGGWAFDIAGINRCNGMPITGCDISNSKYRGNIYINWSDQINGDTDIFLAKSTDGGKTWSAAKRVNNDFLKRDQFFTWMSVDPITGIIYIVFYDRRDNLDPSSTQTHVYLARSDDGGETFKNYRVTETPFFPNANIFFGDYTGIAAYNKKVYPIWMRMDGNTMSVWTSPIDDSQLATGIEQEQQIPSEFRLYQNYPNPFNPETTISYDLREPAHIQLKVYNVLGLEIATLVDESKQPGNYKVTFNARHLERSREMTSGVYVYRLTTGKSEAVCKMVYIK